MPHAILEYMDGLSVIPGTIEYETGKQHAEELTKQRRTEGMDISGLEAVREKARTVFPDVVFDPRYILHSADYHRAAASSDLLDLLPDEGFFDLYQQYTRGSIAPSAYDFLASMSLYGAWCGRRARVDMGEWYHIYPPSSVLIVSMSPGLGKGIALRASRRILNLAGYEWLSPDRVSASMFLGILSDQTKADRVNPSEIIIHAAELAGFFRDGDQATGGLIIDLTDLMDMPETFEYATRAHGREEVHKPTVSLFGCSNMDWLTMHMPREAFTGGFIPRQYFVVCDREDAPIHDRGYPPPEGVVQKLLESLVRARTIRGNVTLERRALTAYAKMREGALQAVRRENDERRAAYLDRRPTNVLRMALLFTIASGDQVVRLADLQRSEAIMEVLERSHKFLYDRIGLTTYGKIRQSMMDVLERHGELGVTRIDLKQAMQPLGLTKDMFDTVIDDLNDSELIVISQVTQNNRATLLFRATSCLTNAPSCVIVMPTRNATTEDETVDHKKTGTGGHDDDDSETGSGTG